MSFFDKVRDVLSQAEKVLPGRRSSGQSEPSDASDRAAGMPSPTSADADPSAEAPGVPGQDAPGSTQTDQGAQPTAPGRYRTHTLQPGQTLAEVAAEHGVDEQQLAQLNGVDPELVYAGQVLRLPQD